MKKQDPINDLLIRRRQSVALTRVIDKKEVKEKHIVALLADISQLGYTLSDDVISVLRNYDKKHVQYFHDTLIRNLRKMVGANVKYTPLFKNFPDDIPDQYEYLYDRIVGYIENLCKVTPEDNHFRVLSCGHVIDENRFDMSKFGACPICQFQVEEDGLDMDMPRPKLKEITPLKIIGLVEKKEIYQILKNLLASPVALSEQDYSDINLILSNSKVQDIRDFIPDITVKEILAKFVFSLDFYYGNEEVVQLLKNKNLTATDILRIAVSMSGGDVSLANFYTKFKSFKNKERRLLLGLLNEVKNPLEDMKRYAEDWKRLGERIHPGDYSTRYPNAFEAFNMIRNNLKSIVTFNSMVEKAFDKKDFVGAAKLLEKRPGEFVRRLDFMLRNSEDDAILDIFVSIVGNVKTLTLMQIKAHFSNRKNNVDVRYFMPKGNMAKIKIFDKESDVVKKYTAHKKAVISRISEIIEAELLKRYSLKEPMKNVFIDPLLKECVVPTVRRNATKALNTVARGTQLAIGNKDARTIRLFIYWKGNVDLDLSILCYDKDWGYLSKVSYTNLEDKERGIVHSGDIRSAPRGASEFIDIDIDKAKNAGIRYVIMSVLSFSGQNFADFESFAGAMKRREPKSGEIYEPKTVQDRFEFEGEGRIAIPLVYDLYEEKLIYTDLILKGDIYNNVEGNSSTLLLIAKSIVDFIKTKPNLFDLFSLHAKARGAVIDSEFDSEKEYDFVFSVDKGITPYQIDVINGEWIE